MKLKLSLKSSKISWKATPNEIPEIDRADKNIRCKSLIFEGGVYDLTFRILRNRHQVQRAGPPSHFFVVRVSPGGKPSLSKMGNYYFRTTNDFTDVFSPDVFIKYKPEFRRDTSIN